MDHATADTLPADPRSIPAMPLSGPSDHPMIDMPFHAEIDGRHYLGRGVSLVRAGISGLVDPALSGAERIVWVVFRFHGFTVALTIEARVEGVDTEAGTATLVFLDPVGEHLPQLRHLMNAYIAGDLVTLGNALTVGSAIAAPARPKAALHRSFASGLRRVAGTAVIVLLSALLVTLAAQKVFQRAFTATLTTPAIVGFEGRTLAATATGQVDFINSAAKLGEVAFAIRANSGQTLSVVMPCDCRVEGTGVEAGSTVFAGDPVLRLSAVDAPLILTGAIPADQVMQLAAADHLELVFADGSRMAATLAPGSIAGAATSDLLPYRLLPDAALPDARLGQMATVKIFHPIPALLKPLAVLPNLLSPTSRLFIR